MGHHRDQTIARRFIEREGCRLAYTVRGEGPPALFIQGTGVHASGWNPQVETLSRSWRCLAFDNRGIGESQPRGDTITVERMAADALALMDAEGWESAHIAGHSLGGLIAMQLALVAHARVRSLALLCTFSRGADATRLTPSMLWTGLRTRIGTRRQRRKAFLELVMPPPSPGSATEDSGAIAARLALIFGHDLADQPPILMQQFNALGRHDVTSRLAELAGIPSLVVSAAHDRIAPPAIGREIAATIPGAHYVEITGAAHGATITQAGAINKLLDQHFSWGELKIKS